VHCRDDVSPDRAPDDELLNLAPVDQPRTVHEVAERLLPAYTVDGGSVHLAGCLLENRLFLRAGAQHAGELIELFLDGHGGEVEPGLVKTLGMNNTLQIERPSEQAQETIRRLSTLAKRMVARRFSQQDPPHAIDVAAVWCKFAQGKLRFAIGEHSIDLSFADWARPLAPPPFTCSHSGRMTHHLAAIDDGRIVAAEEVAACEQSGQQVLFGDLVTCAATGQRVLREFVETCPVTGQTVLPAEMVCCSVCRQNVAPAAMRRGRCEACDRLEPVSEADPRLARLLDEHPLLDRWRRWRLSESATAYHLAAHGWFRKLLVVVDKDSLELKLLATGRRLRSGWDVVEPSQYQFALRS